MSSLHRSNGNRLRVYRGQCTVDSGRSGIGERCGRLFQRFVRWLATLDGDDDCESVLSEVPRATAITAEQTGSFILARRSVWLRITAAMCLAAAAVGFAMLLHGIDAAERRRDAMIRAIPTRMPNMDRSVPPINSGGCLVSIGATQFVNRGLRQ